MSKVPDGRVSETLAVSRMRQRYAGQTHDTVMC